MASGKPSERITCPHCQGSLKAPPLPAGSLCTCPKCGQSFPIGGTGSSAPAAAPPGTAAKPSATSKPAPKPAPVAAAAVSQPKPNPPQKPPIVDAPVRAELADQSLSAAPVVTVADDDVIGQMLLGTLSPAGAAVDAGPPTAAPSADAPRPTPSAPKTPAAPGAPKPAERPPANPAPTADDPEQDLQLQALLSAPGSATASLDGEAHLATATTQPAHQQAPPPPKPAAPPRPKAPDVPVVCKLCGTRMYAHAEQVGTTMRCPDCHSDNEVVAAKVAVAKTRPAAPVDDAGDFTLADAGQRPAYRPMVEPRGDYAALNYLDTSAPPRRPQQPHPPRAIATETTLTITDAAREENEGEEIAISAPVERIDIKEIVPLPPPDDPDEDNQYRGRFRDDEWGFVADPKQKEAWKKSPFYYGILGFLFYPQTLYRVILYSLVLSVDLALFLGAIYCARDITPLLYAALALTVCSSILSALMLGGALPCLVAIAQDTANGYDAVENWPDWNIAEWLGSALTIPAAAFLASLPGGIVASGCLAMGTVEGMLMAPFPILFSELMFFPIVFGSMLAEGSLMPVSGAILGSMQRRGDGWLLFYGASVLLGIVLGISMALVEVGVQLGGSGFIVAPFAAVLWVTAIVLYFRLLGRLLWYVQNYRRERDRPE